MGIRSCGVRHLCALSLLLVSACPRCASGWMRLALSPGKLSCSSQALSPRQRLLLRRKPLLLPGVREGARLAVAECRSQFRHERWNCSASEDQGVFGHELKSGTKETAFIYAVMAAGLVHAVTRSCSQGNMTECGCDVTLRGDGGGSAGARWHWGGCSDNIRYGTWFSRRFLDQVWTNRSRTDGYTAETMNQHNSEVGRQAVDVTMATDCRCHGVSGSCAVKTCWRTMAPFERVGVYLKERYERSVQVWGRFRRKTRRKEPRRPLVDKHQLIFLNKSPNYCLEDRRRGVAGTRGRRCSRGSSGPDSCNLLCCGRGYNTHLVRQVQRCECKFVWCCYVTCRRCESMTDLHTCK